MDRQSDFVEFLLAFRDYPMAVYREHGLAQAVLAVAVSPILIPFAAMFYFSMDRQYREMLDEHRDSF